MAATFDRPAPVEQDILVSSRHTSSFPRMFALKLAAASMWDGPARRAQRVAPSQRVFRVKICSCNLMRTLEEKIRSRPVLRWTTGSPPTG